MSKAEELADIIKRIEKCRSEIESLKESETQVKRQINSIETDVMNLQTEAQKIIEELDIIRHEPTFYTSYADER